MSNSIDIRRHHAVPALTGTWRDFRQEFDHLFERFSEGFDSVALQPFTNVQKLFEPLTAGLPIFRWMLPRTASPTRSPRNCPVCPKRTSRSASATTC